MKRTLLCIGAAVPASIASGLLCWGFATLGYMGYRIDADHAQPAIAALCLIMTLLGTGGALAFGFGIGLAPVLAVIAVIDATEPGR